MAAAPGAYGSVTNVSGSGLIRTSPTGPIPSTGDSSSTIDIAIIARVCPMPDSIRSARRAVAAAFPRTIPP